MMSDKILPDFQKFLISNHFSPQKNAQFYALWIKRFFNYLVEIKGKDPSLSKPDPFDLKDYVSYLAIKKNVSSVVRNMSNQPKSPLDILMEKNRHE